MNRGPWGDSEAMAKEHQITEAEWPLMLALWARETATAAEIVDAVTAGRDISMRTVKTLLRRLVAKAFVGFTVDPADARVYHYRPLIAKDDAVKRKSASFAAHVYQDNVGELLAHFVEEAALSENELNRLQQIVRRKLEEKRP